MEMPMFLADVFLAHITPQLWLLHPFDLSRIHLVHARVRFDCLSKAVFTSALLYLAFLECHSVLRAWPLWFGGCVSLAFLLVGNASGQATHAKETTDLTAILLGTAARVPIFLPHI